MTYSIVALDPATGELGVAVQSRWFNVGSGVPWVEPGVGAVATQSFTEVAHGSNGLRLLREGRTAPRHWPRSSRPTRARPCARSAWSTRRGGAAAHTGLALRALRVAPGRRRASAVQANMMERSTVPAAMLATFARHGRRPGRRGCSRRCSPPRARAATCVAGSRRRWSWHPGRAQARTASPARAVGAAAFDAPGRGPPGPAGRARAGLLASARAYDAMDEAEEAGAAGATSRPRRRPASVRWPSRPTTTRSCCGTPSAWRWRGGSRRRARRSRAASAVEPRSGEHLRRFAEQGHLPGGDAGAARPAVSPDRGAHPSRRHKEATGRPEVGRGRPVAGVGGGSFRLFFSCVFGCSSVVRRFGSRGPGPAPRAFDDGTSCARAGPAPSTGVAQSRRPDDVALPATDGRRAIPIRIGARSRLFLRILFGVTPERAWAAIDDEAVSARFGRFAFSTPLANVARYRIEGPWLWITAIGVRMTSERDVLRGSPRRRPSTSSRAARGGSGRRDSASGLDVRDRRAGARATASTAVPAFYVGDGRPRGRSRAAPRGRAHRGDPGRRTPRLP